MKISFVIWAVLIPAAAQAADNPAGEPNYYMNPEEHQAVEMVPTLPAPQIPAAAPPAGELAQCAPVVPESFLKILSRLEAPSEAAATGVPPEAGDLPRSEPAGADIKVVTPATARRSNVTRSNGITVYHGRGDGKTGTSQENGVKVYRGVPTNNDSQ